MFTRDVSLLQFQPADGQQVQLRGGVAVNDPRGELQCIVETMQHSGQGPLYEQILRLKKTLAPELATRSGSQVIQRVGNVVVLFRQQADPDKRKIQL